MAIQKKEQQRAEHKVMSLLQGTSSILKQVSVAPAQSSKSGSSSTSPNTVVVKVGSGATAQSNKKVGSLKLNIICSIVCISVLLPQHIYFH